MSIVMPVAVLAARRAPPPAPALVQTEPARTIAPAPLPAPAPAPAPAPEDPSCTPSASTGVHTLDHGGLTRRFALDAPPTTTRRPLVLAFHGWGGDPDQLEATTRLVEATTARGWAIARPAGIGKTFAGGACCGDAKKRGVDDVGFVRALVSRLVDHACVDPRRVYATGFSNGGFLAHRLACEAPEIVAAIAPVAGTLGVERCAPSRPVPVLQIHGRRDGIVPFAGDASKGYRSVADTVRSWVELDGCVPEASEEVFVRGAARCVRNAACRGGAEVALCRDDRAAHTWPGGPKSVGWGGSQDLDATRTMLEFFERHARPE